MTSVQSQREVIEFDKDVTAPALLNAFNDSGAQITNNGLELGSSSYNFITARANVGVKKGRWYYEVTFKTSGQARIGWCTAHFNPENNHNGIGNDENSWGFDGSNKQKHHNVAQKAAEAYGDYWANGDVIGCLLDFDQRRMIFSKNGKELGVAFVNVKNDTLLYPAVSINRSVKITVCFGRKMAHLPLGFSVLYSCLTTAEKKECEKTFTKFHDMGITLSASGNTGRDIKGAGTLALVEALGGNPSDPTDLTIMILACKLHSSTQWEFHYDEWMSTWARFGAFNLKDMTAQMIKWKEELKSDGPFKSLYAFTFEYLKQDKATALEKNEALMSWKMLGIDKKWKNWADWEKYWKTTDLKGVSKDTWLMLLVFIEKHANGVGNYSEDDMWPTAIDDFVVDHLK
jgi:hypothetical protein